MIRHYTHQDIDAVMRVWRSASDLAHPFLTKEFQDQADKLIREMYLPNSETWVIEVDGKIAGFIGLLDNLIGGLFVSPEHHGQGLGRALVDKAVGLKGALAVEVFVENPIGRRFYDAYGFCNVEEKVDPHSGHILLKMTYDPS